MKKIKTYNVEPKKMMRPNAMSKLPRICHLFFTIHSFRNRRDESHSITLFFFVCIFFFISLNNKIETKKEPSTMTNNDIQ